MVRRRKQTKRRQRRLALASGDEVPDAGTAIVLGSLALTAAGTQAIVSGVQGSKQRKAMLQAEKDAQKSKVVVGEDNTLKPGQRLNLISTTPGGVLEAPNVGRQTLLGG